MKNITPLIDKHSARKKNLTQQNISNQELLKEKIKISKRLLHELRLHIRVNNFSTQEDEIHFFKHVKPKLCGEIKYYRSQLSFIIEKPNATICVQQEYIKAALKKLESKKKKNIIFYKYYKNSENLLDDKYFVRTDGQFDLFSSNDDFCLDPEFNTTHDMLAFEVITYDLLTQFYITELDILKREDISCPDNKQEKTIKKPSKQWTASKADLVELIYALHHSRAIENGNTEIKELASFIEEIFNIKLGDVYRTFNDVRSRKINQTKFIDKLKNSLVEHLVIRDE